MTECLFFFLILFSFYKAFNPEKNTKPLLSLLETTLAHRRSKWMFIELQVE